AGRAGGAGWARASGLAERGRVGGLGVGGGSAASRAGCLGVVPGGGVPVAGGCGWGLGLAGAEAVCRCLGGALVCRSAGQVAGACCRPPAAFGAARRPGASALLSAWARRPPDL